MPFNANQVKADTKITSKFGRPSSTGGRDKLVPLTKTKRKLYDSQGNPLPEDDHDIRQDIAHGASVVRYHTTEQDAT